MSKTSAQLDAEIAAFLAKPQKLGNLEWERDWAALLSEKHAKARMPTVDELAHAFAYIEREYVIKDGRIDMEQWAEGLAFGQRSGIDAEDKRVARETLKQQPTGVWLRAAERANYLAREQGEAPRYEK
jgi:hypothetical protein